MDLYEQRQIGDTTYKEKAARSASSVLPKDGITEVMLGKASLKQPTVLFAGELRHLTPLWVSENEEAREELHVSDSSRSKIFKQKTSGKIAALLKVLAFRDPHVLIQFWSPRDVGKHQLLTTIDQPFGLGSPDEKLLTYRKDSVWNVFLVDKNNPEDDISPLARVFRRGLPEWTPDLSNYHPKDFAQQDCAVRCKLHGYLALPVFDSTTQLCVGVLELLMSSKNTIYAFEVQQIYKALKTQNLTSPQVSGSAVPKVLNQRWQNELDRIYVIIKSTSDQIKVPFAQTWTVSASTSFYSHDKMIELSCSSFDTRCVGKVCMTTAFQPYYVPDLKFWSFREACTKQHLDMSRSFVGRALLARGSNLCEDITQLCEEEFPLVHYAHVSGFTSCFAIWLHGIEGDNNYVLEFLLDSKDSKQVLNLVQTLKQNIVASEFELGEMSPIAVPPRVASFLSSSIKPPPAISSKMANTLASERSSSGSESGSNSDFDSDSESDLGSFVKTDSGDVQRQCSSREIFPLDTSGNINMVGSRENNNATLYSIAINQKAGDTITDAGETSKRLKRARKRKIDSLTVSAVKQYVSKPLSEAAESFGVSRSTLKRFCRENGILSWPGPNRSKETNHATDPKLPQKVMVKASFKDNMIKFWFPTSSGLLELKDKVAQRLDLEGKLNIKYKDEENDLLLVTCDVDLHNHLEFLASNTTNATVKFIVELVPE